MIEAAEGYARNFPPRAWLWRPRRDNINTMKQQEKAQGPGMAAEKAEAEATGREAEGMVKITAKAGGRAPKGAVTARRPRGPGRAAPGETPPFAEPTGPAAATRSAPLRRAKVVDMRVKLMVAGGLRSPVTGRLG